MLYIFGLLVLINVILSVSNTKDLKKIKEIDKYVKYREQSAMELEARKHSYVKPPAEAATKRQTQGSTVGAIVKRKTPDQIRAEATPDSLYGWVE